MSSNNVTNIKPTLEAKSADEFADKFIQATFKNDTPDFLTSELSNILSDVSYLRHFSGDGNTGMTKSSPEQLINAAKSQNFKVELFPELQTMKFTFDGEYSYVAHLSKSSSEQQMNNMMTSLDKESQKNLIISREKQKIIMGGLPTNKNTDWLTKELSTQVLSIVLEHSSKIKEGASTKTGPKFINSNPQEILELAKTNLYDVGYSKQTNRFDMIFRDEHSKIFSATLPTHFGDELISEMESLLRDEVRNNFEYCRENDPYIKSMKERLRNAPPVEIDDDLNDYMKNILKDDPEYNASDDLKLDVEKNNVTPFKPR